ncbi:MAG: phosphatidate cytidylyltransferase [Clostridium sp.]
MNKRYVGAIVLAPFLIFLFMGGIYLKLLLGVVALMGMYEFYSVVKNKGINCFYPLGYLACVIYFVFLNNMYQSNNLMYLVIALTFIVMCVPVINSKYNFIDSAVTVVGFIYIAIFFSFISLLEQKQYGDYLIWLIFIIAWLGDTSAYYSGRMFGKRKLAPKLSPHKTIEGSIGGLIGAIIGSLLFGSIISKFGVNINIYHYAIIGLLGGVFGQIGDLVASAIKRYVKVKDYSNLIPGHGGILDRFDSILFVSVVVFYYVTFIIRL